MVANRAQQPAILDQDVALADREDSKPRCERLPARLAGRTQLGRVQVGDCEIVQYRAVADLQQRPVVSGLNGIGDVEPGAFDGGEGNVVGYRVAAADPVGVIQHEFVPRLELAARQERGELLGDILICCPAEIR